VTQSGLTLIEGIFAVLILASCVIGITTLYTQRQNIARGGRLHESAVALAQEMANTIRNDTSKHNYETTLGARCDHKTGLAQVTNLVACWQDQVEQELTNGSARISLDRSSLPAQYVIIVSWSEPRTGTASYVLRVTSAAATTTMERDATRAAD
jgi:Tfp pilus assembly protein PilV